MLQIKSNADIDRDRAKAEAEKLEIEKDEKVDLSLSDYIWQCWKAAVDAKRDVEEQLLVNKRQIMGIYEADKLAAIKALKVPEIFMLITDVKCSNAAAWVEEILFQPNSLPWDIRPTPIPDLPQEIVSDILQSIISNYVTLSMQSMGTPFADPTQVHEFIASNMDAIKDEVRVKILEYAKKTSDRMRDKINDQLVEGNWYKALSDAIPNIILKTGFLKGPVYRKRKGRVPKINPDTGAMYLAYEEKVVNWYESVSPFNIYPAPNAVGFDDGFLIERLQLTPIRLQELLGVEGYRDDEIRAVLREHGSGELANWINTSDVPDEELEDLTNRDSDGTIALYDSDKIDCLEYWGAVQGSKLIEYGMSSADIPDEDIYYHCCCWMIGKHVIKAMLNEDINGVKPYYKSSFRDDKDSFWGRGLPEVIPDVQQGANAMARAILTNAAISSGPVVERNIDRIRPEDRADDTLYPLKMFDSTNEDMLTQAKAYEFYQPAFIADRLIVVFDKFIKLADEHSGVPAYATGDPRVGGAGRALADYEEIVTPNGPVEISELLVGDKVSNTYGSTSTVIGVYPQGKKDIYRVTFTNGKHVDCDLEHLWSVRTHHDRKFQTLTTSQIIEKGLYRKTIIGFRNPRGYREKWMIPMVGCVEFNRRDVTIDPYTMGALIGNGDSRCRITVCDKEILDRIPYEKGKQDVTYRGNAVTYTIKGIKRLYHAYGLNCKSIEKFIPEDYLYNTKNVRLELLRGMMDTDGCCTKDGDNKYSSSSYRLIKDFMGLVESLGGLCGKVVVEEPGHDIINGREIFRQEHFAVKFTIDEMVYTVPRKVNRAKCKPKRHVYITSIEAVGQHCATCITVDSDNSLYLCRNYIPTHNTASGLSMLMSGAARGIKSVIKSMDDNMIAPSVKAQYMLNIENFENYGLVCDFQVEARGSVAMLAKEQQAVRKTELLSMTANPLDAQIIGMGGRKYMLRDALKALDMDVDNILPDEPMSDEKLKEMQMIQQLTNNANAPGQATLDSTGAMAQGGDTQTTPSGAYGRVR